MKPGRRVDNLPLLATDRNDDRPLLTVMPSFASGRLKAARTRSGDRDWYLPFADDTERIIEHLLSASRARPVRRQPV